MYEKVKALNTTLPIFLCDDSDFQPYGRMISGYDFSPYQEYMKRTVPDSAGVTYTASLPDLENHPVSKQIEKEVFGELPIQVGCCYGKNQTLNALEYHKSSEMVIAITDILLLLASVSSIENKALDTSLVMGFYLLAGKAVELYATTLHFAPLQTNYQSFQSMIILPRGTNQPLEFSHDKYGETQLLFKKNKWLLAHQDSLLIGQGAYKGLTGKNISIEL